MNAAAPLPKLLQQFEDAGILTPADTLPVLLIAPRFGVTDPEVLLGLALVVRAPRVGHPAVDLGTIETLVLDELRHGDRTDPSPDEIGTGDRSTVAPQLRWPEASTWTQRVVQSPMVGGPADRDRPFAAQRMGHDRSGAVLLMTRRMFREQERVATALLERAQNKLPDTALVSDLDRRLEQVFGTDAGGEAAQAVRLAANHPLAVVIGGPGTGKTFSVSRLLATLLSSAAHGSTGEPTGGDSTSAPLRVLLAAPTGKAAARMREALREAVSHRLLSIDDAVRRQLQDLPAQTIHRLVGIRPDGSCRHSRDNPLPADVVVVDEVSMVDLANMRRLLEAVPRHARLILLGDRDQLASVEAGCVLADIVEGAPGGPLRNHVASFTISRRFADAPDIGLVAACLQSYRTAHPEVRDLAAGDRLARAVDVLCDRQHARGESVGRGPDGRFESGRTDHRIEHLGPPEETSAGRGRPSETQLDRLAAPYLRPWSRFGKPTTTVEGEGRGYDVTSQPGYAELLRELRAGPGWSPRIHDPRTQLQLLRAFEQYRVLAVHRRGPLGVAGLERTLSQRVRTYIHGDAPQGRFWVGRAILVTTNAYDVGLMNGDVGLILPTPQGLAGVFPGDTDQTPRVVATARLPEHEGAFAMTVHKSQGSQFVRVAVVLAGGPSPIQTRELVYTAVTRAQDQLAWLGGEAELAEALQTRVARASGLRDLLESPTASEAGDEHALPRLPPVQGAA